MTELKLLFGWADRCSSQAGNCCHGLETPSERATHRWTLMPAQHPPGVSNHVRDDIN